MSSSYRPDLSDRREDCNACDSLGAMIARLKDTGAEKPGVHSKPVNSEEKWEMQPPPDIVVLGNAGWTLLHTMATYYPDKPSEQQKRHTVTFLRSFTQTFPCSYCASDFADIMAQSPPRVQSQREFSQWMCEAHNIVNENLGKPQFDCSLVDQRWKIFKNKIE